MGRKPGPSGKKNAPGAGRPPLPQGAKIKRSILMYGDAWGLVEELRKAGVGSLDGEGELLSSSELLEYLVRDAYGRRLIV